MEQVSKEIRKELDFFPLFFVLLRKVLRGALLEGYLIQGGDIICTFPLVVCLGS